MKRTLLCGNCGKLVPPDLLTCPRCGAPVEGFPIGEAPVEGESGKSEPYKGGSPGRGEAVGESDPTFENFISEPFDRMESMVKKRYGQKLEELYRKLLQLEEELNAFLGEK